MRPVAVYSMKPQEYRSEKKSFLILFKNIFLEKEHKIAKFKRQVLTYLANLVPRAGTRLLPALF